MSRMNTSHDKLTSSHDKLMRKIERFLRSTGMTATVFGIGAMNDGKLVFRMRQGSYVTLPTADAIDAFMAANRDKKVPRPLNKGTSAAA